MVCEIVRFTDDHFPRWVEARFVDADGLEWVFEDKVPIFTAADLRADTRYPVPAVIRCVVIDSDESLGRTLIDTSRPDGLTAKDGVTTRFWVESRHVTP